jgi:DNA-binding transcriptional ArsR family regulator
MHIPIDLELPIASHWGTMTQSERARCGARASILKALAHPTRLLIVDTLSLNPRCVYELTRIVGADVSTVSKHLAVLRHAGIVADRKEGSKVTYSLETPCLLRFIGCLEEVMKKNARKQLACIRK